MFNTLAHFSRIAIGCLTLGLSTIVVATPIHSETEIITDPKPLETYTGTLEDLDGTESRNRVESLADEGEHSPNVDIPSLEPEQNSFEAKTEALNSTLEDHDYTLGDVKRPTYRVPLINF